MADPTAEMLRVARPNRDIRHVKHVAYLCLQSRVGLISYNHPASIDADPKTKMPIKACRQGGGLGESPAGILTDSGRAKPPP